MSRRGFAARWGMPVLFAFVGFVAVGAVRAEDGGPDSRVARLSLIEGSVRLANGGQTLGDQAVVNSPLVQGTQVTTGSDGRAEVQFDDGSVVRLAPQSSLTITSLTSDSTETTLNGGMGYFELQGRSSQFHVRFGNSVATTSGEASLRIKIDVLPGELAVMSGEAHLEDPNGSETDVRAGESARANSESGGEFSISTGIDPDSWDAWNSDRAQALTSSESVTTPASPEGAANNPAWGDLNTNGTWYDVPEEGYVWSPYVAASGGWDPYGSGYWMLAPGVGYVWVSGEPWGFLPYRCGFWNYYDSFGWGWNPGPCRTWGVGGRYWGGGGSNYGGDDYWINVRKAPKWYRMPVYPRIPRPRDPESKLTVRAGGGLKPLIPVQREPHFGGPALPPRERGVPVNIGGRTAEPLPTTAVRPRYNHIPATGVRADAPTQQMPQPDVQNRGNMPHPVVRPGYVRAPQANNPGNPHEDERRMPDPGMRPAPVMRPGPVERPAPMERQMPSRPAPMQAPAARPMQTAPAPRSAPSGDGGRSAPAPSHPAPAESHSHK